MQIVFLGTSGSWPTPRRNVSAIAVMQVSRVFLSHFHGDHFLGLPGLIQSMNFFGREIPLDVYGPDGAVDLVAKLLSLGHFKAGYDVRAHDLSPGDRVAADEYSVTAFAAVHTVPGLSFVLEEKARPGRFSVEAATRLGVPQGPLFSRLQVGEAVSVGGSEITPDMVLGPPRPGRKIVYTGDSMPTEVLVKMARSADVLIHDATSDAALEEKANQYGHSSSRQAAHVAKDADVGLLVLTHVSPRYEDTASVVADAKAVFDRVVLADDFLEINVPYRN
jgi:ribonuclease Z